MSDSNSFLKGVLFGALFCLVLAFIGTLTPSYSFTEEDNHKHHHVKVPSKDELRGLTENQMEELTKQVRVYCLIMVHPKVLQHWATVKDTWSKHCDKAAFYSSEAFKELEAIDLKEPNEWARLRKALKHAYDNAGDIRWFFIARPTTFAIIENLKYLVLAKDPSEPFYIGHAMKSGELDYVEYESGIVLSYEALNRLMNVFQDGEKCPETESSLWKVTEEKRLAICLKYTGVFAENGEDLEGKGLFNSKSVERLITDSLQSNPSNVVEGCCSDLAITFSGMSANQMQVMMFGVYRLRPYGHNFNDMLLFQPPEGSEND